MRQQLDQKGQEKNMPVAGLKRPLGRECACSWIEDAQREKMH